MGACDNSFFVRLMVSLQYGFLSILTGHGLQVTQIAINSWGRDKMAAIFQTTFSKAFSWMKTCEFLLKLHWSFFPKCQVDNIPVLVPIVMIRLSTHIYASMGLNESTVLRKKYVVLVSFAVGCFLPFNLAHAIHGYFNDTGVTIRISIAQAQYPKN